MRLPRFRPRILVLEAHIAYLHTNKTIRGELMACVRRANYTIEPVGHDWFIYPCVAAENVANACGPNAVSPPSGSGGSSGGGGGKPRPKFKGNTGRSEQAGGHVRQRAAAAAGQPYDDHKVAR
jgi:hypothetical protein